MSDRDHEELFLTRLRLILAAGHTAAYDLRADISELLNERRAVLAAAPVEPPVLSRAAETLVKTKAMVEERLRGAKEREAQESTGLVNGNLDIRALEAVLESLSHRKGN